SASATEKRPRIRRTAASRNTDAAASRAAFTNTGARKSYPPSRTAATYTSFGSGMRGSLCWSQYASGAYRPVPKTMCRLQYSSKNGTLETWRTTNASSSAVAATQTAATNRAANPCGRGTEGTLVRTTWRRERDSTGVLLAVSGCYAAVRVGAAVVAGRA